MKVNALPNIEKCSMLNLELSEIVDDIKDEQVSEVGENIDIPVKTKKVTKHAMAAGKDWWLKPQQVSNGG